MRLGVTGDAHAVEFAAGLHGFGRVGEALDEGAELADAGVCLLESDERLALVQVGDGDLVAVGILLEDLVVVLDGGGDSCRRGSRSRPGSSRSFRRAGCRGRT